MLNGLDLFSGIGGLTIAMGNWVKPVAYCENDPYCQAILLSRMRKGSLPLAPIWDDVRSLSAIELSATHSGRIDIVYGGFPCQDISVAGNGVGLGGERSGLFFEIVRLVRELRPRFVFLENVPAITTRGLDRVTAEFSSLRYDSRWGMLSAFDMGAPHLRERWFLLAHADGIDSGIQSIHVSERKDSSNTRNYGETRSLAYSASSRGRDKLSQKLERPTDAKPEHSRTIRNADGERRRKRGTESSIWGRSSDIDSTGWWAIEPDVGRVANGIPARVDRIRGLGNAVVPIQAREAFKRLMGL